MRTVALTCVLLSGLVLAGCADALFGALAQPLVKGLEDHYKNSTRDAQK